MKTRTTSTPAIDRRLKKHYLEIPEKRLAKMINKSSCFVRGRLRQLGLVIPREIIEQRKVESRIKKGNIPFNKGRNQKEWMSAKSIRKTAATRFKTGNLPHNTKSDFDISVRPDNRGVKMLFIRVKLGSWMPLQRYVWQQHNGPIPNRMKVVFKDQNTFNCNIDNLEIVTSADLMKRNTVHNYGPEIFKVVQLRGALNRQINKHLKKLRNEK